MKLSTPPKPLTDKTARAMAKQIVKDGNNVRVKFGKTNGRIVLHVYVPERNDQGRTITSLSEWEDHPANGRVKRNREMAEAQPIEQIMESNQPAKVTA